jgi:hypothetical protein
MEGFMRVVLCFLFALVAAPAWAEWLRVGETDEAVFYIESTTIRKDRHLRWVWEVQDFKQMREDGLMSRRVLDEFDCREEEVRILSMFNHAEPMAKGAASLLSNDPFISIVIQRSTPAEVIFNIVCAY